MHSVAKRLELEGITKFSQAYKTSKGKMFHGRIEDALDSPEIEKIKGKVNLILTSPPFPLVRKKRYGNETGEAYLSWLESLAGRLADLLTEDGSIVIEIGNAWEQGSPVMSTLPVEALLAFKKAAKLHLCQHVICHTPARLPSPAEWVNVRRIRLKDSFTHVWWMSRSKNPKADNRNVLGGSISANVIELDPSHSPDALLKYTGTSWDQNYREYCAQKKLVSHPARMQSSLSAFFIQFLTQKDDLVLDPFAGSNTTGAVAEDLGRRWIGIEAEVAYIDGSRGRFAKFRKPQKATRKARKPAGKSR